MSTHHVPRHEVAGVGAGPANLSLAALGENVVPGGVVLYEGRDGPGWHPGLLQTGTRLQTAWIKDLATLVDPRNRLTFLNYLVRTGRVYALLNAQFDAIPRLEYAHYLAWASQELGSVQYGVLIDDVDFDDGFVLTSGGRTIAVAQHLVMGLGTRAQLPDWVAGHELEGVVLAEDLSADLAAPLSPHDQVLVVGGGQTGAECVLTLLAHGHRDIRWLGRRPWFAPLDDSPSANDFYRPEYQRFFGGLPDPVRRQYVAEQVLTSDGISVSTLQEIYQRNYELFLRDGRAPVMMLPGREVVDVRSGDGVVAVWCRRRTGGRERHTGRRVVLATGRQPVPMPLAPGLLARIDHDEHGDPVVQADYSVRWHGDADHKLFVQNRARFSHGLADPNLSLLAVRSAVILNSLLEREVYAIRDVAVSTLWA